MKQRVYPREAANRMWVHVGGAFRDAPRGRDDAAAAPARDAAAARDAADGAAQGGAAAVHARDAAATTAHES